MASEHIFGRAVLPRFLLDPQVLHLNHGSFGAVTREVMAAQEAIRRRIEARPSHYFRNDHGPELARARDALAGLVGARAEDLVLVENATAGCNAVLTAFDFAPGDEVLVTSEIYGAVRRALAVKLAGTGARLVEVPLHLPLESAEALVAAVAARLSERTRLAIFDHVSSTGAIVFPLAELIAACRRQGVPVLIDGAHALGMLDLQIPALGADFYTANAHKWLCGAKGSALLWVAPPWQAKVRPPVISHGQGEGFQAAFAWTGTRDPSALMVLPQVVAAFEGLGGRAAMVRNRALAAEAAQELAEALGGQVACPPDMLAGMASIGLPVAGGDPERVQREIGARFPVDTAIVPFGRGLGLRLSAHVYNETADYRRLLVWLRDYFAL